MQVTAGVLKLGKLMRLVPHPVIFGFVNGLAIIIFMSQMEQFQDASGAWLTGSPMYIFGGLVLLTMLIIWGLPKLSKAIPASLVAILSIFAVVVAFGIDTKTVGDIASIQGGFPPFHIPVIPFTMESFLIILPYASIMAGVGLIESLLTLNIIDEITETRGQSNREAVAQGAANILSGLFSGMGGCAMIGQSMINVKSGGRTRIAGTVAAVFLLVFILFGSGLIEQIPLAALVGVMFMVVIGTFAWNSFKIMTKVPLTDAFVIVLVTVVTVMTDLATAVVVGVIVSALAYAWENAKRIHAITETTDDGAKVYKIQGPLFFGSADGFVEIFDVNADPETVIIDFEGSRVADQSALQAIESIADKYAEQGKAIQLRHLTRDSHTLLRNAGHLVVDSDDDPDYEIAADYSVRTGILGGH